VAGLFDAVIRWGDTRIRELGNVGFFLIRGTPHPLIPIIWKNAFLGVVITAGVVALPFYSNRKLDRLRRERVEHDVYALGAALTESNNLKGALVVDYTILLG